ncbi:14258_t:CDS:2 [Racocetra persica]|uniref:14258_t:CDS:1 n=1 Tax=Racocetra persica TaxID=160502 RepID=A0ACA9LKC2_9GLOM|nr:14258_t:CDS:2 [Racocetra persica]
MKVKGNETYKRGCYSKGRSWVNTNIANQKGNYKTYNYTGEVIKDTKAASSIKGKAFEHYLRPVNTDRTDSISLVKDEVQMLAIHDQNLSNNAEEQYNSGWCYQNGKNSNKDGQKVLERSWKTREGQDCNDKIVTQITNPIKKNYFMNEVKCIPITWAIEKFGQYLRRP